MALDAGTHLGPYEILNAIGSGGMGEVYRARDTRLNRSVAIKILPSHLAGNSELRERFEREARAVSSINHPHICTLYDIGQQDGVDFIVLELLEGDSLFERISQGPLPVAQVLRYSMEIADALDKAHRHGVVHRDLKPGNVMLTKAGSKLLDFGLAKLSAPAQFRPISGDDKISGSATEVGSNLTVQGAMLGTLHYMSPEQLEGRDADPRSDIFSLGVLIYEMVTGRRAFQGKSQASVVAAILDKDPPPLTSVQPAAPAALERVVGKCLEKDPDERWQSAKDLAGELKWIAESEAAPKPAAPSPVPLIAQPESAPPSRTTAREILAWCLSLVLLASTVFFAIPYFRNVPATQPAMRFSVETPETTATSHIALSPDGLTLAYVARSPNGLQGIWLRPLDSTTTRYLPGTDAALHPFWSPDSRFVGFFASDVLKKVNIGGGAAQRVTEATGGVGGTWNRDGVIVFTDGRILRRVSSEGGAASDLASDSNPQVTQYLAPYFLPDGDHYLYLVRSVDPANTGIYVRALAASEGKRLVEANSPAVYAAPGNLLYLSGSALVARRFDASRLEISGETQTLADQIQTNTLLNRAAFTVSANGLLAYRNETTAQRQFVWFDRAGKSLESIGPKAPWGEWSVSPDEKRIAVARTESIGAGDVWMLDLAQDSTTKFTFNAGFESFPLWTLDGQRVLFSMGPQGRSDIYQKLSNGAGQEELFIKNERGPLMAPEDISKDGRYLVYRVVDNKGASDLWVMPLSGDRKPNPYVESPVSEAYPQISPDGRHIAYASNEVGNRFDVYVQTFPEPGGKQQVSVGGGYQPRWRQDGKELFFVSLDFKMMSVEIRGSGQMGFSAPKPLFDVQFPGSLLPTPLSRSQYYVSRDGQRFLISIKDQNPPPPMINVVVNWQAR